MGEFLLDMLWRLGTWGVVAVGLGVAAHGLLTDLVVGWWQHRRRRGGGEGVASRVRCPGGWRRAAGIIPVRVGCWYDMRGATPNEDGLFRCPECGKRSSLRQLGKSRRRWRMAAVGIGVVAAGLSGRYSREVYRKGLSAVPDVVLVLVPFDERAWIETGATGGHRLIGAVAAEIGARDLGDALSPWAAAHLGRRVRDRFARDPDYGVEEASRAAFERLESTPFTTGIDSMPFRDAVAAIAEAAGVGLDLDEEALGAVFIDAARRITVPAFGMMTCEQALDWACDRARASRGWAVANWDLADGRLLVADRGVIDARNRVAVFPLRGELGRERRYLLSGVQEFFAAWQVGDRVATGQMIRSPGRSLLCVAPRRDLMRTERLLRMIERADGWPAERVGAILAFAERLERATITPIGGEDTLDVLLYRMGAEAGLPTGVDSWGLELYRSLAEATARPGDRTAPSADPFGRDLDGAGVEPIGLSGAALRAFDVEWIHGDAGIAVGLRSRQLTGMVAAYRLPKADEADGARSRLGLERDLWPIVNEIDSSGARRALGRLFVLAGRVVVLAPPGVQARVARAIDEFVAERSPSPP